MKNIEYIKARNIKTSSDIELESDVDGDKSDNLPVDIKILGQHIEVYSVYLRNNHKTQSLVTEAFLLCDFQ
ncbi:TPA: hypothetical protein VYS69_001635 [Streptococcus pneumoniae]|nr:hypothetical protein [Streptococcus pneumoniae]